MADPIAAAPVQAPKVPASAPVDVVVAGQGNEIQCSVDPAALERLQQRVQSSLLRAAKQAFRFFTVEPSAIAQSMTDALVLGDQVCAALFPAEQVTEGNHNELRKEYMGSGLALDDAVPYGVIGKRFAVTHRCPPGYDWTNPLHYSGVSSCQEVIDAESDDKMPMVMYAVPTTPSAARAILEDARSAVLYSRYSNDGPISCTAADGPASFHSLRTMRALPYAEYIIRIDRGGTAGSVWNTWSMRPNCTVNAPDGSTTTYAPDTLMLDFGMRVFVPVHVEASGKYSQQTLVFTTVAALPRSSFQRGFLRSSPMMAAYPFKRFLGGEFAKGILIRERIFGWKIDGDRAPLLVEKQEPGSGTTAPQ